MGHNIMYFHYKSMVDNDMPGAWSVWTPGVLLTGFIKSTIHCSTQNMKESSGPSGFGEKKICFSH